MKSMTRAERPRFDVLMMFMFFLRKVQWNRSISFTIDELLHFRVELLRISSGVPCATIEP